MTGNIYLTEMSLKELLEGKVIFADGDGIEEGPRIMPPKTDELGIMRIAGAREDRLLDIINDHLLHQETQSPSTDYIRGYMKGIEWTKVEIQKMFGK